MSPSSRRAWIEMQIIEALTGIVYVALLAEGVDRNSKLMHETARDTAVALLAEGVDRNLKFSRYRECCR